MLSLQDLYTVLSPNQRKFFQALDLQLAKVESFYLARESEMRSRGDAMRAQIQELKVHRDLWVVCLFHGILVLWSNKRAHRPRIHQVHFPGLRI